MNDTETIAALAAALEEKGKLPWWIREMKTTKGVFAIHEDGTSETVLHEEAVLTALSGVAAEVLACGKANAFTRSWAGYEGCTYHAALIGALKQIEPEEVKK